MIMTNIVTLPSSTAYSIGLEGYEESSTACEEGPTGDLQTKYSPSTTLALGMVFFDNSSTTNPTYDNPFNGQQLYYYHLDGRTSYAIQVDFNGIVTDLVTC